MPYEKPNDQDIKAAIALANQSNQELRNAKALAREQALDNRSWSEYAGDVGRTLFGMKDIGLFHDIIPGAVQSAKQAFTAPARAYKAGASGQPFSDDQMLEEALNMAGMITLGAGAVPAEINALRAGASIPPKKIVNPTEKLLKNSGPEQLRTYQDLSNSLLGNR